MKSLTHYVRWVVLAICTMATLTLNHQRVATWRVAVPASQSGPTVAESRILVLKERVVLPSLLSETPALAGPVLAVLPALPNADPLGVWLTAQATGWLGSLVAPLQAAATAPAVGLAGRLLGTTLSPQAP